MKASLIIALVLVLVAADFPHRTDEQLAEDMIRFDLDKNGKLSLDEIEAGSRMLHAELKIDLGEEFYPLLRQVMQEFMVDDGEMSLATYKIYRDTLESGKFNDLFGEYFAKRPPVPLSE